MQDDPIANVLDDLLKLDDILACMVARRNMISVMPTSDGFKPEVMGIWDIIKRAMDDVFGVIREYSQAGLSEMEFRLQDYEVLFYVFHGVLGFTSKFFLIYAQFSICWYNFKVIISSIF